MQILIFISVCNKCLFIQIIMSVCMWHIMKSRSAFMHFYLKWHDECQIYILTYQAVMTRIHFCHIKLKYFKTLLLVQQFHDAKRPHAKIPSKVSKFYRTSTSHIRIANTYLREDDYHCIYTIYSSGLYFSQNERTCGMIVMNTYLVQ